MVSERLKMEMGNFLKELSEGPVDQVRLIILLLQLSLTMHKLESIGIKHFDLKEDNILMMNDFQLVIADMGTT